MTGERIVGMSLSGVCPMCNAPTPSRPVVVDADRPAALLASLAAARAIVAEREAELREIKGPCASGRCVLHLAHRGPCVSV